VLAIVQMHLVGRLNILGVLPSAKLSSHKLLILSPYEIQEDIIYSVVGDVRFEDMPDFIVTEDVTGVNAGMFYDQMFRIDEHIFKLTISFIF
jgi:hypothetical protein